MVRKSWLRNFIIMKILVMVCMCPKRVMKRNIRKGAGSQQHRMLARSCSCRNRAHAKWHSRFGGQAAALTELTLLCRCHTPWGLHEEVKIYIHPKPPYECVQQLLFIIAETWKQPVGELINFGMPMQRRSIH